MKRFIKICAVTGLILLFLGLGITAVSAAMGGRFTSTLPSRMASRVWHNHMPWTLRWDNDRMDDWDDLYNCCLLYTSPSPRDPKTSRMPSSA